MNGREVIPGNYIFYKGNEPRFAYVLAVELHKIRVLYVEKMHDGEYVAKSIVYLKVPPLIVDAEIVPRYVIDTVEATDIYKRMNTPYTKEVKLIIDPALKEY